MPRNKTTPEPEDTVEQPTPDDFPVGYVARLPENLDRLVLVVGYDDEGYPLVSDLPGPARVVQSGLAEF